MSAVTDAIAGGSGLVVAGLKLSLPGQTVRVAKAPYTSLGGGHFDERVISWGSLDYQVSDRNGVPPAVTTRVRIHDKDRTLQRIYSGASADSVRGSAAVIYLMTPGVAYNTEVVFTGVLTKMSFPEPFVVEVSLRTNDDAFQRLSPRGGWQLTPVAWPSAKAEVFDKVAPIVYGIHDASYTQTGPGLVPTLYVDTIEFRYLVCAGKAKAIDRVYVNGVSTGSGWATEYVTRNGRIYTCINFTTDQGTAEITADVQGYETVGDGSGTVITNPATQWAHYLSNFVFGDYMTGSWLSTNALVDSSLLTAIEAHLTSLGARGSMYQDERGMATEATAQDGKSFGLLSYWTPTGTVALGFENLWAQPGSGTRLRWYRDEMGPFALEEDDYRIGSRIVVRQAYSSSQGAYLTTFEVTDPGIASDTQDAMDLVRSQAR